MFDACPEGHVVATTVNTAAGALLPRRRPPPRPRPLHTKTTRKRSPRRSRRSWKRYATTSNGWARALEEIRLAERADPITIQRLYKHFLEDAEALGPVLTAVLPGDS